MVFRILYIIESTFFSCHHTIALRHGCQAGSACLFAESVVAYYLSDWTAEHPFVCCFFGIIIVDCAAAWIPAVDAVLRRFSCGVDNWLAPVAVVQGGEGARLVDDPGNCIRKGGVLHAVEDDRAHGYLPCVAFTAGLR